MGVGAAIVLIDSCFYAVSYKEGMRCIGRAIADIVGRREFECERKLDALRRAKDVRSSSAPRCSWELVNWLGLA